MLILAIDTAGRSGGVALAHGSQILAELLLGPGPNFSRRLLPAVDFLLAGLELDKGAIEGLAVSRGPGFFTGLRVGLATAQGLALGAGLPVATVSSLRLVALNLAAAGQTIWAVADARRSMVYAAPFRPQGEGVERLAPDVATTPAKLAGRLAPPAWLVGDGARLHRAALLGPGLNLAPAWAEAPRPGLLALEGARRLAQGQGQDPAQLLPNYCRPSDAEVRFGLPLEEYSLDL